MCGSALWRGATAVTYPSRAPQFLVMLVSSNGKRDLLSSLLSRSEGAAKSRGFGLVARYDAWLAHSRGEVCAPASSKSKRPNSPALALLLSDEITSALDPEQILEKLGSPSSCVPNVWRCGGCQTTDQRLLVKGADSQLTCSRCSVVASGPKMVGTVREKMSAPEEEDKTVHNDGVVRERDAFAPGDVESADDARKRRIMESGVGQIPTQIQKKNGFGQVLSTIQRQAGAHYREQTATLSPINERRNRELQIELVALFELVRPVDASLAKHVRTLGETLFLRSQAHEANCAAGCSVSVCGESAGLLAKVLMRVVVERLLPLYGAEKCPLTLDCSYGELLSLVDRCNRLVLREGVHSALCRTSVDMLIYGDYASPCKSFEGVNGSVNGGVNLAKHDSAEILCADPINGARDAVWSLDKMKAVTPGVRDAVLHAFAVEAVRAWVIQEAAHFSPELIAIRVARAVHKRDDGEKNPDGRSKIEAALRRCCEMSVTRPSTLAQDEELDALVQQVTVGAEDDDVLL